MIRKVVPLIVCCLIILAGCTTNTPSIPLLLRYADGEQHELVKITWNLTTGEVITSEEPIVTFTDTGTVSPYHNVWPKVETDYWVSLIEPAVSNTAVYWNGSDKLTLFTIDDIPAHKDINIIKINNPQICQQYTSGTNCIATDKALYVYDKDGDTTTLFEITASGNKTIKVPDEIIGVGKSNNKIYLLTFTMVENYKEQLLLYTVEPDGSMDSKLVEDSLLVPFQNDEINSYRGVYTMLTNGSFYMWNAKVDISGDTPRLIPVSSLKDGFDIIAHAGNYVPRYSSMANPQFSQYKDYLLAVGHTFSYNTMTVAAFKDDELVGFMLINPLNKTETTLTTYNAIGEQLKSYTIKAPVQVIVPQP